MSCILYEMFTEATVEVILVPPAAPTVNFTSPLLSITIVGHIEEKGCFPGAIKLDGDAGTPKALTTPGVEKSSIESLSIIPVVLDLIFDPKLNKKSKF